MKTATKWWIFIVLLIANLVIAFVFGSGLIHNVKLWTILTIIGGILTPISILLLAIPTNEQERLKEKKRLEELGSSRRIGGLPQAYAL